MNWKLLAFLMSLVLFCVAAAMLLSSGCAFFLDGPVIGLKLLACSLVPLIIGIPAVILFNPHRMNNKKFGLREGFATVTFSWLLAILFGMIPYMVCGNFSVADALFETSSGFSTTGATICSDVESLPDGLLFWRAMTQWLGGLGIVVLSVAILPLMNIGGQALYNAEMTGAKSMQGKVVPRIKDAAAILWCVYVGLTVLQTIFLKIAGMRWFDAICHAFTTTATGGFSTKNTSIAFWDSTAIELITIVFMFLSGCNFILHYQLLRDGGTFFQNLRDKFKRVKKKTVSGYTNPYWQNEEFRFYTIFVLLAAFLIMIILVAKKTDIPANGAGIREFAVALGDSFRHSLFQTVSIITTTGFTSIDYDKWPTCACMVLYLLMLCTACEGSTTGGVKCWRVILVMKYVHYEIRRCLYPHQVQNICLNGIRCDDAMIKKTIGFCLSFAMLIALFAVLLSFDSSFESSSRMNIACTISASISSLTNVGPGFGDIGASQSFGWMSAYSKCLLAFEMLLGRLELYTLLVIFLPSFWKK